MATLTIKGCRPAQPPVIFLRRRPTLEPTGAPTQAEGLTSSGGTYQDPNLDQLPQTITTPYFPEKEYTERLAKLYDLMKSYIPEATWKRIEGLKEGYIKKNK